MDAEIQHLLDICTIEPVPVEQRGTGFYSLLFLVAKRSGAWRGILDLKALNKYIKYRQFKMHSLRSYWNVFDKGTS